MTNPNDRAFTGQYEGGTLTKREYFAGLALSGILASETEDCHFKDADQRVEVAILHADSLIEKLNNDKVQNLEDVR